MPVEVVTAGVGPAGGLVYELSPDAAHSVIARLQYVHGASARVCEAVSQLYSTSLTNMSLRISSVF